MGLGTLLKEGAGLAKAVLKDGQEISLHTNQTGKFITVDAKVGDEVVGNATASTEDMIPDVFVSEPFRRRGLATAMFQEAAARGAKLPNLNETRGQSPDGHALRKGVAAKVAAGTLALGAGAAVAEEPAEAEEQEPRTASPEALGDEEGARGGVHSLSAMDAPEAPVGASMGLGSPQPPLAPVGLGGMLRTATSGDRVRGTIADLRAANERLTGRPATQGQAVGRTILGLREANAQLMGEELPPMPETARALFVPFKGMQTAKTQTTQETDNMSARGIRNNNPGNIDFNKNNKWQGQLDHDPSVESRFARFDKPESGIRAMGKLLQTYQTKHKLNTVEGIINRWAPPVENNSGAYVAQVSKALGVNPNETVNLKDSDTLFKLVKAIIKHENGTMPYDDNTILNGVRAIN